MSKQMFICTVCGIKLCREEVGFTIEGLPLCSRCKGLFGEIDFHLAGCPCCGGHEATDRVIAECRESLSKLIPLV